MVGAGALFFALGAQGIAGVSRASETVAGAEPNIWVRIGGDGAITIVYPMTEMGQGSSTALPLILAEELDADWADVTVEQLDEDDRAYGNPLFGGILYTAGSTAVRGYFDPLRLAGAQARRMLIEMTARHWSVPVETLSTEPSRVVHPASGRGISYGEIVTIWDGSVAVPEIATSDLKPRAAYRYLGQHVPRFDVPAKSRGAATYAIDMQVPDMLYASVLRAPVEGETPRSIDDGAARAVAGVVDIVQLPDGIAVVADRLERAQRARDLLDVAWTDTSPARAFDSAADLDSYAEAVADMAHETAIWDAKGDAANAIAAADLTVERTYRSDYAYHAQIEPMAVTAAVDPDGKGAEVWAATQSQTLTTLTIAQVLDTTPDRVRLNMLTMGGSFGRRTALMQDYVRDALLTSRATGRPVKVVWSREDDVKFGVFRPAAAQKLSAGLTSDGAVSGWRHRVATPSVIAFFNPFRWEQVRPHDIISVKGSENPFYTVPDFLAEHVMTERRARLSPWRGIGSAYTTFAAEAFLDELAEEAGSDPVAIRMALMRDNPRGQRVLARAVEMSDWSRPRTDTALGLAFGHYGGSQGVAVVEIGVSPERGMISVLNVWGAFDGGLIISPDNARAQLEGGIVFGISSALRERISIVGGEVQQSNFYDYEILRAHDVPEITIDVLEVDAPPTGLGELSTPMMAPAIANAFHALRGRRLRHMPFTPDRVTAALA